MLFWKLMRNCLIPNELTYQTNLNHENHFMAFILFSHLILLVQHSYFCHFLQVYFTVVLNNLFYELANVFFDIQHHNNKFFCILYILKVIFMLHCNSRNILRLKSQWLLLQFQNLFESVPLLIFCYYKFWIIKNQSILNTLFILIKKS